MIVIKERLMNLAKKIRLGKRVGKLKTAGIYIVLIVIAFSLLFPIFFMVTNSLMSGEEVVNTYYSTSADLDEPVYKQFKLIPEMVSLIQYYMVLLRKPTFLVMFWNSVIVTAPVMVLQIIVAVFGAYAFGKLRFPLRDQMFFIFIVVMLMPLQVTLVPNYIILKKLNLLGSYLSVILPGTFSAFGIVLLRQYMRGIPDEYCEAARIDGAGYFKTFMHIMLPQCRGIIASIAILVFIDNWNMVEQPLIFLSDSTKYPLSIYLSYINQYELGVSFACGVIYMIPVMLIYFYGENYLVEGIQLTGIK